MEQEKQSRLARSRDRFLVAPKHWPIFYKILVSILVMVVPALVVSTYINARTIRTELEETIGEQFKARADTQIGRLADILSEQLTILQNIALIDDVKRGAATANARYTTDDAASIESQLLTMDGQWAISGDEHPEVMRIIDPQINRRTVQLLDYKQTFPDHLRLLVTDRYGDLVAATDRPDKRYQAQKEWWLAAYNDGDGALYVSQPKHDEDTDQTVLQIAVPIFSEDDQVIGVVLSIFRMRPIYQAIGEADFGDTGRVVLLNADRVVIAEPPVGQPERLGDQMPLSWGAPETLQTAANWRDLADTRGVKALAGHALISDIKISYAGKALAIQQLDWMLFVLQAHAEAYASVTNATRTSVGVAVFFTAFALVLAFALARTMVSPIARLVGAAQNMTAGDLSARAVVLRRDETGKLARAFNAMAEELAHTVDSLEHRVMDRTRNLQTAAEVSRATTSVLDPDELLRQVVDVVRERFGLYYVGLFLLDDKRRYAILQAGTGQAGQEMLAQGHRREVGDESMVGRCVSRGEAQIAFDTGEGSVHFDNPFLPETRSKLAMPLRSRGRVIGGMSVQSVQERAFDDADVAVMQTMSDQVAVAIDNARLFAETQAALKEARATYQRYVRQAWGQYTPTVPVTHYETERRGVPSLGDTVLPEIRQALERKGATVLSRGDGGEETAGSALVLPVTLHGGEVIGALGIHDEGARQWSQDDIALAEAITERMALAAENLRLFDQTRRRAAREQLAHEITAKMRSAIDLDSLLQISIQEMGAVLDTSSAFVQLAVPPELEGEKE